jgi:hypothetical protein
LSDTNHAPPVQGVDQECQEEIVTESGEHRKGTYGFGRPECFIKWPHKSLLLQYYFERELEIEYLLGKLEEEQKNTECPYGTLSLDVARRSPFYFANKAYARDVDKYSVLVREIRRLRSELMVIRRNIERSRLNTTIFTESDVSMNAESPQILPTQNLVDMGGDAEDVATSGSNSFWNPAEDTYLDMDEFVERPVKLLSQAIPAEDEFGLTLRPWNLFLADPAVRSKLKNYAFARFDLVLRISISATPFHYGKVICSYFPYDGANAVLNVMDTYPYPVFLKYSVQQQGAITIDAKSNKPLEMVIPYLSVTPMGRLWNNSASVLTSVDDFEDFDLGRVEITVLNKLQTTQLDGSLPYIHIYAYAKNFHVAGSTGTLTDITTESDERKVGPVERMASSTLPMVKAMTSVPSIAPLAVASHMAVSGFRDMAAFFGWSYPVQAGYAQRVKMEPFANGANTIGMDTGKRITCDPLQELTIDPSFANVSHDELAIADICKREGLLSQVRWSSVDQALDGVIFQCAVSPRVGETFGDGWIMPTPLAFAATPFRYWRGSMTFRIEIVCNAFQRGKLLIGFEPNVPQYSLMAGGLSLNKQQVRILDIQECQNMEFVVEWNSNKAYSRNVNDNQISLTIGPGGTQMTRYSTGVFYIVPFTELQTQTGFDVGVNVYVRSDSMTFNRFSPRYLPDDPPMDYAPARPALEDEKLDITSESYTVASDPVMTEKLTEETLGIENINLQHFGETHVSFRSLLKRFWQNVSYIMVAPSSETSLCTFNIFPTNLNGFPAQFDRNLYKFLRYAFVGQRGGFRKRLLYKNSGTGDKFLTVSLTDESTSYGAVGFAASTNPTPPFSQHGSVAFCPQTNSGIEFEVPFYSSNLFAWSFRADPFDPAGVSNYDNEATRQYVTYVTTTAASPVTFSELQATGEDFTFVRWAGAWPYRLQ